MGCLCWRVWSVLVEGRKDWVLWDSSLDGILSGARLWRYSPCSVVALRCL